MAKKLNTIQQRNHNNLLTAVESNDRTTAKEVFDRFFKGKEIEEVVIDKLKEKHDILRKKKKTKFLLNLNQQKLRKKKCVQI